MSNINRDYHIKVDVKNSIVIGSDNIYFFSSDVRTTNLFIEVVNEVVDDTLELIVRIVPPLATTRADVIELQATKHNNKLFEVQLPNAEVGTYKMEIVAKVGAYENTSNGFSYEVKPSVLL